MSGLWTALLYRLSRLRMAALGYHYVYDRAHDELIVAKLWSRLSTSLEQRDDRRRRFARAIAQYRAQLAMRPALSKWVFEGASVIALPFFLAGYWLTYRVRRNDHPLITCDGVKLVHTARWKSNPEIFVTPGPLSQGSIVTEPLAHHRLTGHDVGMLLALLKEAVQQRTPFPFQFALKCAVDTAKVRAAVLPYQCSFVLVYWEFSCSLSVITHALADRGIETYNVMHGDKNYFAKHAFFEVDRCYCWNDFYTDLFQQEHVRASFKVFTNPAFVLTEEDEQRLTEQLPCGIGIAAPHLATLVADETEHSRAAQSFASAISDVAASTPVTIRPHPFYTKDFDALVPHLSADVIVIPPAEEPAREFILRHAVIVGTLSSMLLEAAHIGKQVVVVSTAATQDLERYHFLYTMENVTTSAVEDLSATIGAIDPREKVVQTGTAVRSTSGVDTA